MKQCSLIPSVSFSIQELNSARMESMLAGMLIKVLSKSIVFRISDRVWCDGWHKIPVIDCSGQSRSA